MFYKVFYYHIKKGGKNESQTIRIVSIPNAIFPLIKPRFPNIKK